jgi:hypothetical protein
VSAVLPALAALSVQGLLVSNRRGRVLHVATPGGAGLTPTGRLRRGTAPICGQHGRRWQQARVDGRRLCRRCTRQIPASTGNLLQADREVFVELLADTFRSAPDLATVQAATLALCAAPRGAMTMRVAGPDGYPVRLTQLAAAARERLSRSSVGPADRGWMSQVKNAPGSRFPRRVA